MRAAHQRWKVKDKRALLITIMQALAGSAHISFEGDLYGFQLLQIAGASEEETPALKRNTIRPRQDFVIVPLEPETMATVLPAIGGNLPRRILHIQVEKNGHVEFAAFDRFHEDCIVFGDAIRHDLIKDLVSRGVISSAG